jgi:hypothetical protein
MISSCMISLSGGLLFSKTISLRVRHSWAKRIPLKAHQFLSIWVNSRMGRLYKVWKPCLPRSVALWLLFEICCPAQQSQSNRLPENEFTDDTAISFACGHRVHFRSPLLCTLSHNITRVFLQTKKHFLMSNNHVVRNVFDLLDAATLATLWGRPA